MDPENQLNDDAETAPKTPAEQELERIRQKWMQKDEAPSRGRFIGVGAFIALLLYALSLFILPSAPPEPQQLPQPVRVDVPDTPVSPPADHPRQYEESIGPPTPPPPPILAKPLPKWEGKARVALVIDDCGISSAQTGPVLDLPKEVTLAFLPYGHATRAMAARAQEAGHDVMLHMPMQPLAKKSGGRDNPGPDPVMPGLPSDEIARRVAAALDAVPHAVGVNNHMGSAATADGPAMEAVMGALKGRDVFFLDSYTSGKSVAYRTALEEGLKTTRRDVFLDDTISEEAISQQLNRLVEVAHKQGYAVAIGHPHPLTMQLLKNWLANLDQNNLELIPVKDLTRSKE